MIKAYIIGKYYSDKQYEVDEHIQLARSLAKHLWVNGYAVFCPHSNSAFMSGLIPESQFLEAGKTWLKDSDTVHILPNFNTSKGSIEEIQYSIYTNKILYFYGCYRGEWHVIFKYALNILTCNKLLVDNVHLYKLFLPDSSNILNYLRDNVDSNISINHTTEVYL